jgi:hypothetical protein
MKICERGTFTSVKLKTAQSSGKAPCLEYRETWGTLILECTPHIFPWNTYTSSISRIRTTMDSSTNVRDWWNWSIRKR